MRAESSGGLCPDREPGAPVAPWRTLPPEVDRFWNRDVESADWTAVEAAVSRLSDQFTVNRPEVYRDYTSTPENVAAYGLFFFPRSFVIHQLVLDELVRIRGWNPGPESRAEGARDLRILDLGAGTGAAGLSAANYLIRAFPALSMVRLQAADHSRQALRTMEALAEAAPETFPRLALTTTNRGIEAAMRMDGEAGEEGFDLVLLSFTLNELLPTGGDAVPLLSSLLQCLRPGGILLVTEPARQEHARRLQAAADWLLANGQAHPCGPYLHPGPCPFAQDDRWWNHDVRDWEPPESAQRINRHLWRSIHELKFSWSALRREPLAPRWASDAKTFRVASPLAVRKGHLLWSGVGADGQRHTYELQTRHLKKTEIKELARVERGRIGRVGHFEEIGDPLRLRVRDVVFL